MNESYLNWVLAAIATVVGTLAATVATLWKVNESRNTKAIEELTQRVEDCEAERAMLRVRVARLETQMDIENADADTS